MSDATCSDGADRSAVPDRPVTVVTGAAGGIGAATVRALLARGDSVVAVDRNADALAALATEADSTRVRSLQADLADPAAVDTVAAQALDAWGRVDALCLVAGVGQLGPTADLELATWDAVLDTNLRAPFLLSQRLMPALIETRGCIAAVASVAGLQGWAYSAAYAASKAGLIGLMRSLAAEYGPAGLRVNVVAPGGVDTAMASDRQVTDGLDDALRKRSTGLEGRRARPHEVADALVYLTSQQASFVNGAVLPIDGGAFA